MELWEDDSPAAAGPSSDIVEMNGDRQSNGDLFNLRSGGEIYVAIDIVGAQELKWHFDAADEPASESEFVTDGIDNRLDLFGYSGGDVDLSSSRSQPGRPTLFC